LPLCRPGSKCGSGLCHCDWRDLAGATAVADSPSAVICLNDCRAVFATLPGPYCCIEVSRRGFSICRACRRREQVLQRGSNSTCTSQTRCGAALVRIVKCLSFVTVGLLCRRVGEQNERYGEREGDTAGWA